MQVGKSNIYELFNGTKQYVIPSYQRPYSQQEKECERLWKNIVEMERKKQADAETKIAALKESIAALKR